MSTVEDLLQKTADLLAQRQCLCESTYRLQFHAGFTFRDACAIVPYLSELGITHCHASPYLQARAGSRHGYDITNHRALNPEIGWSPSCCRKGKARPGDPQPLDAECESQRSRYEESSTTVHRPRRPFSKLATRASSTRGFHPATEHLGDTPGLGNSAARGIRGLGVEDLADGAQASLAEVGHEAFEEAPRARSVVGVDLQPGVDERAPRLDRGDQCGGLVRSQLDPEETRAPQVAR